MTSLIISNKEDSPQCHTTSPLMTGTSIIGVEYKDGIMLCCDTLISYGSLHYKKNLNRFIQISSHLVLIGSGEISDLQELSRLLIEQEKKDRMHNDGIEYSVEQYGQLLSRLCYQRRNKADPYLGQYILAGWTKSNGYQIVKVDMFGNYSREQYQLTGMAELMSIPIIHNYWNHNCQYQQAKEVIQECFRALFSRHARTTDRVQFCTITSQGVNFEEQVSLGIKWDYSLSMNKASENYNY